MGATRMTMKLVNGVLTPLTTQEQAEYDARQTNPSEPPISEEISKLQLSLGLFAAGLITQEESEEMAAGPGIPTNIETAINTLPVEQRAEARIRFKGMTRAERSNPLINAVGWIAANKTPTDMDAYWRNWSKL